MRLGALATVAMAAALAAAAIRCGRHVAPNVLFVLVDTLRADRVGNPARGLTPFLDRYAADATVFERAYSPSAWTIPSIASLFGGQRPFDHGVLDFGQVLPPEQVTLAEVLAEHGFDTAALLASTVLAWGGFDQGFATYRVVGHPTVESPPDATEVNAAALAWLDGRNRTRPFFLYLHYVEPHHPYRPHDGITAPRSPEVTTTDDRLSWRAAWGSSVRDPSGRLAVWRFTPAELQRLTDLYDGEVAYLDRCLEALFGALEKRGALANTIVVVTADHGEEFGEHTFFGHGVSLYEAAIHVPLIVRLPDRGHGVRSARPVETAGIAAALLRAVGIEPPATFRVPPVPFPGGDGALVGPGPVVSQLAKIKTFAIWSHRAALIDGERKLVLGSGDALSVYDLAADPGERERLPAGADDAARVTAVGHVPEPTAARAEIPPELAERLRALGYMGEPSGDPAPQ